MAATRIPNVGAGDRTAAGFPSDSVKKLRNAVGVAMIRRAREGDGVVQVAPGVFVASEKNSAEAL